MPLLQAALNGDREHPAVPRTPDELAAAAAILAELAPGLGPLVEDLVQIDVRKEW